MWWLIYKRLVSIHYVRGPSYIQSNFRMPICTRQYNFVVCNMRVLNCNELAEIHISRQQCQQHKIPKESDSFFKYWVSKVNWYLRYVITLYHQTNLLHKIYHTAGNIWNRENIFNNVYKQNVQIAGTCVDLRLFGNNESI